MTLDSKALKAAWDVVNERKAYLQSPEENLGLAIAVYLDEAGTPTRYCEPMSGLCHLRKSLSPETTENIIHRQRDASSWMPSWSQEETNERPV